MSERVNTGAISREGADHLRPNLAPRADQPFTELPDRLAAQAAADEPEVPKTPVALPYVDDHEWRFRTYPGLGSAAIKLNIPVESDDMDDYLLRKNKNKRWLDRKIKQGRYDRTDVGKDGFLKADKAVFDLLGEYHLNFKPVTKDGKRQMEAQYVTREKVVADYIRGRLANGEFAGEIYEDVRPIEVEVNGQRIRVVPADESARVAMAAAAAG